MIKTQIQIPDHLYQEAERIAREYEMSFAEVVHRGIERIAPAYPPRRAAADWNPPTPRDLGWKGLTPEELKEQAQLTIAEEMLELQR
jgi:hypothetical protein